MLREAGVDPGPLAERAGALAGEGKPPMFFASETKKQLLGVMAVADIIKDDSPQVVREP